MTHHFLINMFTALKGSQFKFLFTRYIYDCSGQLGHVTCIIYLYMLSFSLPVEASSLALIGQAVSEEKIFQIVDERRMTDGRTTEHGYTTCISSHCGTICE